MDLEKKFANEAYEDRGKTGAPRELRRYAKRSAKAAVAKILAKDGSDCTLTKTCAGKGHVHCEATKCPKEKA